MTMSEAIELHRARLGELGRSAVTIGNHIRQLDRFGRFLQERGVIDVRAVSRHDVDAFGSALGKSHRPHSLLAVLGIIKGFFAILVDAGRLFHSPAEHLRHQRIERGLGRVLSEEEVRKLGTSENTGLPRGIRNRALFELLYATGLRRKEICGLGVRDVDIEAGVVRVRHGKGDKERLVLLTGEAQRWLGEYLRQVRPRLARKVRAGGDSVFLSVYGRAMTPGTLTTLLQGLGRRAGVEHVSCYAFRRTMATDLLRGGADVKTVAEILGHATLDPTERYTQVVPADLREVQARTHPRARRAGHG